jgi:hypothetical protein
LFIEHALILSFGFRQASLYRPILRRRLQLSTKPCVGSGRLHRIEYWFGHVLMDLFACRAFERLDVEANGPGRSPHQLGARLARGAKWSLDHDAIAFGFRRERYRTLSHRQIPRGIGDAPAWNFRDRHPWSILLTLEKLMYWPKPDQRRPPTQRPCDREQCRAEELGEPEVANAALLF